MAQEQEEYEGTGIESEISEEAFESDPTLKEYQTAGEQEHWQDELDAARKERKTFNEQGVKIIKRYAGEQDSDARAISQFNIFFANTEIKQAALYARTPVPDIKRRFNDPDDQVSRVAANVLQRNISYELECENFDAAFKQMTFDRLVPGIGLGWLRLEQEEPETQVDEYGQEVISADTGYQLAAIDYVSWDDFQWAPCRTWTECRWVGRRVPMSKAALKARFAGRVDPDVIKKITFSKPSAADTSANTGVNSLRPRNVTEATTDIYEMWDKERRLIFFFSEHATVPLDVQKDSNEFDGFFPTPLPPLGRFTTSNTTPISDFSLVKSLYNELDQLNNRITNLINALQVRYLYDSSNEALKTLYSEAREGQGIPVKDWSALQAEKGGMRGSIEFAPLNEIATTYRELIQARDLVKAQIYEVEGISDFLRGVQQPYVTATAAGATSQASSSRITVEQHQAANYIQRLLRLKAHLICKFYKPQTLMQRVGTMAQEDQQYIPQALQLLADEQMRHFRLEVSVDSIQAENWNTEKAERNELITAFTGMLQHALPLVQQVPSAGPIVMNMIKFSVAGYKGAKTIEGAIDAGLQQMAAQAAQKQSTPPQPNPAQLKANTQAQQLQADMQATQLQEQTKLQIAQMDAQLKAQDLAIKQLMAQTKAKQVDANIAHQQAAVHIDAINAAHVTAMDVSGLTPNQGII